MTLCIGIAHADDDLIDADRPGIADGSRTLKRGHVQIENGIDAEHAGEERSLSVPLLLRYGISDRLEVRVESDTYQRSRRLGETTSGWNPVSLGFKEHLFDDEGSDRSFSLGVIGRWFLPSGSGEFRSHSSSGDVRLTADIEFGEHWALNPNIGIAVQGGGGTSRSGTGAATLQYNLTAKANGFVDAALQRSDSGSEVLLDTGAAWIIGTNTQLDLSIGWGAHGSNAPNVFWSAGVSRRF